MDKLAIQQKKIIEKLESLSPEWLEEVDMFIQFIIFQSKVKEKQDFKPEKKRVFGCGKNIVLSIADDFNEPLEDFTDYMQ